MEIFKKEIIKVLSNITNLTVAVHNGVFHSDDVYSVIILKLLAERCGFTLNIIRTRDIEELKKADMRVDVGGRYDESTWDFDHHQNDPNLMQEEGIKHAAIGLLCKWCMTPEFLKLFRKRYLLGIEYQDNTGKSNEKYPSIGFVVQPFVPAYGEEADFDVCFETAVACCEPIMRRCIKHVEGLLQAEKDFNTMCVETLADGKIVVFKQFVPVNSETHPEIMFTIFPVEGGMAFKGHRGTLVKPEFRGLNANGLSKVCRHPGVFTHKAGFTGVMKTLEGVKKLCLLSL